MGDLFHWHHGPCPVGWFKKRGGVLGAMGAKRGLVKNVKGKRRSLGGTFKARKHILQRSVRINRLKGKNSQVL
jgi:hypothetical protein